LQRGGEDMPIGWIDFSKTERNKIISVLDMLSENGTLDELGIAPIRDGFSNLFFPGTSTIQTRAKYFFIVPYIFKDLERNKEMDPNRIKKELDNKEKACGMLLRSQNPNENGIIGNRSLAKNKWVKRTPADIYWAGLRQYGFFNAGNFSIHEYIRAMCEIKKQKEAVKVFGNRNVADEEVVQDDKDAGGIGSWQFWRVPTYQENWFEKLSLQLTTEEGAYIKQQIVIRYPDSMMAFLLQNNIHQIMDVETFHDEIFENIITMSSEEMLADYHLAVHFSRFVYVLRVIYNVIISDEKNSLANIELENLKPDFANIANIDIDFIMNRLQLYKNSDLKIFLKQAKEYMLKSDIDALKICIRQREIFLKGQSRAKTCHPGQFDENIWYGGGYLNYRFYNARTIIKDIFESEVCADVESE